MNLARRIASLELCLRICNINLASGVSDTQRRNEIQADLEIIRQRFDHIEPTEHIINGLDELVDFLRGVVMFSDRFHNDLRNEYGNFIYTTEDIYDQLANLYIDTLDSLASILRAKSSVQI